MEQSSSTRRSGAPTLLVSSYKTLIWTAMTEAPRLDIGCGPEGLQDALRYYRILRLLMKQEESKVDAVVGAVELPELQDDTKATA